MRGCGQPALLRKTGTAVKVSCVLNFSCPTFLFCACTPLLCISVDIPLGLCICSQQQGLHLPTQPRRHPHTRLYEHSSVFSYLCPVTRPPVFTEPRHVPFSCSVLDHPHMNQNYLWGGFVGGGCGFLFLTSKKTVNLLTLFQR